MVSKVNVYTFRIFLETAKAMGEVRWVKGGMLGRICDNMWISDESPRAKWLCILLPVPSPAPASDQRDPVGCACYVQPWPLVDWLLCVWNVSQMCYRIRKVTKSAAWSLPFPPNSLFLRRISLNKQLERIEKYCKTHWSVVFRHKRAGKRYFSGSFFSFKEWPAAQ